MPVLPARVFCELTCQYPDGTAAVDFLVVPTLAFERLFAFVVLGVG